MYNSCFCLLFSDCTNCFGLHSLYLFVDLLAKSFVCICIVFAFYNLFEDWFWFMRWPDRNFPDDLFPNSDSDDSEGPPGLVPMSSDTSEMSDFSDFDPTDYGDRPIVITGRDVAEEDVTWQYQPVPQPWFSRLTWDWPYRCDQCLEDMIE